MLRRSSTGLRSRMLSPSISISPALGSTIRLIMRRSVVLPLPDEPTRTVVLRDGIVRVKSLTATVPSGNCFDTERKSIIGLTAHSSRQHADPHLPVLSAQHYSE